MRYGVCHLAIVPCRAEASDKSEMVTQLLFGDYFEILEQTEKWAKIKIALDNYECWVDRKQYLSCTQKEFSKQKYPSSYCYSPIGLINQKDEKNIFPIVIGSSLSDKNKTIISGKSFSYDGDIKSKTKTERKNIIQDSFLYLNAPYLWGGKTPFGIDCSGFVQMVYRINSYNLPRDASQQAELGKTLSFLEEATPADLAFFDNAEGNIIHVGIILENNRIIHASGKVRIDKLDHYGIFNEETNSYSHRLRLLKKIL